MNARDWALIELDRRRLPGWSPGELALRGIRAEAPADPRDRALAEQIITGTIKNLLLLQHLIEHYARRRLSRIDGLLQKILAIGIYQLRFLTRVPASAAVDEAVKQARRVGRAKGSGLVNAVLRNAVRADDVHLPDVRQDPARYAQVVLSHPPELFDRLVAAFGPDRAIDLCRHNNVRPPTIVRLIRGADPRLLEVRDLSVVNHEQPGMFVVCGAGRDILARWAQQGIAQAQDPTAAGVADLMELSEHHRVLDRCAGLGTKTMQIAEIVRAGGQIIAMEPNAVRAEKLLKLGRRRGIATLSVHRAAWMQQIARVPEQGFDRVLVDAPCSNSGVLARRAEARYAQSSDALRSLVDLQRRILDDTAGATAPGGLLVYSTCSIWEEENQQVIDQFLGSHPDYRKQMDRLTLPSTGDDDRSYRDGGYVAALRRRRD
jgi:16S rRNA (cytosine967-C5)-methyltransferase